MNTISILINLFIGLYIITNKYISSSFIKIFNNNLFKIIILFIMIIMNKPILSLLICVSYIITLYDIKYPNKNFDNCLGGSNNINKMRPKVNIKL